MRTQCLQGFTIDREKIKLDWDHLRKNKTGYLRRLILLFILYFVFANFNPTKINRNFNPTKINRNYVSIGILFYILYFVSKQCTNDSSDIGEVGSIYVEPYN